MNAQYGIVVGNNHALIGKTLKVIVDEYDPDNYLYIGRSYKDAPEIDGRILFTSQRELVPGVFTEVLITDADEYDLIGESK